MAVSGCGSKEKRHIIDVAGKVYMQKKENRMLNIFYGDMKEAVYNTAAYFKYDYEDSWIIDPFVKEMSQDVDRSTV